MGHAPSADPWACRRTRWRSSPSTPGSPSPAPAEPSPAPAEPSPAPAEPSPAPAEPPPAPAEPCANTPARPGTGRGSPPAPASDERLAVLADRVLLTVAHGHRVAQRPGGAHHDLGAVLAWHGKQGVQAQPERLPRLVRLQPAPCQAEADQ